MIVASSMIAPWQAQILIYLFALRVVSLLIFGRRGSKW